VGRRGKGSVDCGYHVVKAVSARLGVRLKRLYFRLKGSQRYPSLEVVMSLYDEYSALKAHTALTNAGIHVSFEKRKTLRIHRLYAIRKFVEDYLGQNNLPPRVLEYYEARYVKKPVPYVKHDVRDEYRPVIDGLVNVYLKVVAGKYPNIILTYGYPEKAREVRDYLQSMGMRVNLARGKRARSITVYRLRDVRELVEEIINLEEAPEKFKKAYREAVRSPFSIRVDEEKVVRMPEFWRVLGLILGDNDTRPNSFSNTSTTLVSLFIDLVEKIFGEDVPIHRGKRPPERGRKECWRITVKGTPGRVLAKYSLSAHEYVDKIEPSLFWQLITGLYEADGSVTFRYPSEDYRVPYPDISIRLSQDQVELASAIKRRLDKEGVPANLNPHTSTLEIRITSLDGFKVFFTKVNPAIKNPADPESFRETKTKPENVKIIHELYKKHVKGL